MDILTTLQTWLEPLMGESYFVIDVQYIPRKPAAKLLITLDGDNGIGIDKCAEVSRQLSALIDENDLIPHAYTLEVSSPGADKPLALPRQYTQHVGRTLRIELQEGDTLQGKLTALAAENLQLEVAGEKKKTTQIVEIPFENIKKATVVVAI